MNVRGGIWIQWAVASVLLVATPVGGQQPGSGKKTTGTQSTEKAKSEQADSGQADAQEEGGLVQVPKGIDHRIFDDLLKKYVDEKGFIDYAAWQSSDDFDVLIQYTELFAPNEQFAAGAERIASLINAYNAFTIRWILENYPTESIREFIPYHWGLNDQSDLGKDYKMGFWKKIFGNR